MGGDADTDRSSNRSMERTTAHPGVAHRARMVTPLLQTPDHPASLADIHHPVGDTSPGAAWLLATASRVAEVQQGVAERQSREPLLTLHAHYAVEGFHLDPRRVAADLQVPLRHRAHADGQGFAAEVELFRVARRLLDKLTSFEPLEGRREGVAGSASGRIPMGTTTAHNGVTRHAPSSISFES